MSLWLELKVGLWALVHSAAADRDVAEEAEQFLAETAAELEAGGASPAEARRAARLALGHPDSIREEIRSHGWEHSLALLVADVRYGLRQLRRHPAFALVSVLTVALGIGATTAIFSAANPVLFAPLPYPHPDRLAVIWDTYQGSRTPVTFFTSRELGARSHDLSTLAIFEPWQPTLSGLGRPELLQGESVGIDFFRALGVAPALGRDFLAAEGRFHGPKVTILSYRLWQRRFAGDRAIIGRRILLDGDLYTVVGVTPHGFEDVLAPTAQIWAPEQYDPSQIANFAAAEWGHHCYLLARLRPGVSWSDARRELDRIAAHRALDFPRPPWAALTHGFIMDSLHADVARGVRPVLLAILAAALLLLGIAAVNVTNLLLARGTQRRGEFALRTALGAGRSRLLRQVLTETAVVAALGGVAGVLVAEVVVHTLVALAPAQLPRLGAVAVNIPVLVLALVLIVLIGLAAGMIPAMQAVRGDPRANLRPDLPSPAAGRPRTRRALVVVEIALAAVLLIGAGLLLHSLERLFAVAPGFDSSHLLTLQLRTVGHHYDDPAAVHRYFEKAVARVGIVPGVAAAALTSLLPLSGAQDSAAGVYGAQMADGRGHDVFRYVMTPGYFQAMRIPLLRGRVLGARDLAGAPPAVVISESLAKTLFAYRDPLLRRMHVGPTDRPWYTVVGVVGDVKQSSLGESQPQLRQLAGEISAGANAVYLTSAQSWFADQAMWLVVRARGEPLALVSAIEAAVWSVDKDQPIAPVVTMDRLLADSTAERRFTLLIFAVFALAALFLTAIGLYGLLAGSVAERTREIGIRAAMGAPRGGILVMVLRQGMALAAVGGLLGLAVAMAASRLLEAALFQVSPLDPLAYLGALALLAAVAALACLVPARRAARVDPAIALRSE